MPLRRLLISLCLSWLWVSGAAHAQIQEGDLKAAFVYNFAKFVEWPPEAWQGGANTLVICAVGAPDPFLSALPKLAGKQIQGRDVAVRPALGRVDSLRGCQVVVVGESEAVHGADLARLAASVGALTVSALPDFADRGGIIGLLILDNRIQFDVNLEAAQSAHLKLAAQFLRLARKVIK